MRTINDAINQKLAEKVGNYELRDRLPYNGEKRVCFASHYGSLPQDTTITMKNGVPVEYRFESRGGAIGTKHLDELMQKKDAIVEALKEINPEIEESKWLYGHIY